ncbi:amino acid ABC transporter substrate-binding protein [Endozoicomonas sp. SM1973]|uniref:Amino acid ABC transporter substrate-binding protein n=1 Tax=Spartinivicinus marinus TaxID=2994442 RepID=A0A853ILR9_9GAMM|nr:amino acid ABC transporter substrate-binding protein [Spartinivicinus marinus]MCX4026174.1 amino acid ABC transporter substrate-binding protein [Spartinivicinus marinus]NYZ68706.1 amino acid ABC transporter substrate-binding protein [Spartinivicinus marinus]
MVCLKFSNIIFPILIFVSLISSSCSIASSVTEIIYPPRESADDKRDDDIVELLEKILIITEPEFGKYEMRSSIPMNEARYTELLSNNKILSIIWTSVTKELEYKLLPIRIPIRKGVLGYRIFLIRKNDQQLFENIKSLDELKKMKVGQGHFWNDVKVFEENGFKVVTGSNYEGLFGMLSEDRFDYFSRGFNEAPIEYDARKDKYPNLFIERKLLLYYPWPKFFYVAPTNIKLAARIEAGFRALIDNGTHEIWFQKYNQAAIEKANLRTRRLFKLKNPLLPASVPLDQDNLWFDPLQ